MTASWALTQDHRTRPLALLLAWTSIGAAAAAESPKWPPFRPQQASMWCWAASTQMVLEHLDPSGSYEQALHAEKAFSTCPPAPRESETCGDKTPLYGDCNRGEFPSFGLFGYEADEKKSALDWSQLKAELDACRPFVFGWCFPGQCGPDPKNVSGHLMVAVAADVCQPPDGPAVPMLRVFNPAPCCRGQKLWIPYSQYASGGSKMDLWNNYYRVRKQGETPPTDADVRCRLTTATAEPQANLEDDGGSADLVHRVISSCFPTQQHWRDSTLLRSPIPAFPVSEPEVMKPTRRQLVSLGTFRRFIGKSFFEWKATLVEEEMPRLLVFPVQIEGRPVANVVLEESPEGHYRLAAIEDSESARLLLARKAMTGGVEPSVEFQIVELGLPIILADENAVAVTSESACQMPAAGKAAARRIGFPDFSRSLAPMLVQ